MIVFFFLIGRYVLRAHIINMVSSYLIVLCQSHPLCQVRGHDWHNIIVDFKFPFLAVATY